MGAGRSAVMPARGGLRPFSKALNSFRPRPSPIDKARLGATILDGARQRDGQRMEKLPGQEWLTKWSSEDVERFGSSPAGTLGDSGATAQRRSSGHQPAPLRREARGSR